MTDDRGPLQPTSGPQSNGGADGGGSSRTVNIDHFHGYESDIRALTALAKDNPEIARQLLANQDSADKRSHSSHRLGLAVALTIVCVVIFGAVQLLISFGLLASIAFIIFVVVLTALIRVVLTGEWSDTSWVGKVISGMLKIFGAKASDE